MILQLIIKFILTMTMVEFLYSGEANVDQSNLDVFLALADDLRLKGLNGTSEEAKESKDQAPPPQEQERVKTRSSFMQVVPFSDKVDPNRSHLNKQERALALNSS